MHRFRNNPCQNCSDRTLGCHGKCEKYKEAKATHEEMKETIRQKVHEEYVKYGRYNPNY